MGSRPRHFSTPLNTPSLDRGSFAEEPFEQEYADRPVREEKPSKFEKNYKQRRVGIQFLFKRLKTMPFGLAVVFSTATHILTPLISFGLFALLAFVLMWLMNFNLYDYFMKKPVPQQRDVVFTLVPDTNAERPDSARFKAAFNQQAGGETNPDLETAPPDTPSSESRPSPTQPEQQAAQASPPSPPKPEVKPVSKTAPPKPKMVKPTPVRPSVKNPAIAMPAVKPQENPQKNAPEGPVAKAQNPSNASPASPQQVASAQSAVGSPGTTFNINNSSMGNPEKGNAKRPGVNAIQDVDYGPMVADIQRRIKRNWTPPRGGETKRVKVKFFLRRDGRLVKTDMVQSSGDATADAAALKAIELSAPFKPFPPQVQDDILPIEFTFDYEVFNPNRR